MPLLLLDLDNTLIDRAAAFRHWAGRFARAHGVPDAVEWLVAADGDGFEPRERVADRIRAHVGLGEATTQAVLDELRAGLVEEIRIDPAVPEALDAAAAAGWTPVVVTNGTVHQQERKLRHTGLDRHVAGWVISEAAGVKKPDPRIFRLAAEQTGQALSGAWMIGDSAEADIGGAHRLSIPSAWLHRGREWSQRDFRPTVVSDSCPAAIRSVLAG